MRYALLLFLPLFWTACSTPRAVTEPTVTETEVVAEDASYAGSWELKVMDTPAGTVNATLMLSETADGLDGSLMMDGSEIDLRSVNTTDDGLVINFYSPQYQTDVDVRLKGMPSDEQLTGMALSTYMAVATRKK